MAATKRLPLKKRPVNLLSKERKMLYGDG